MLSIVETLKQFRTIHLVHRIIVYKDHNNLTFESFTTERLLRWRLMSEEYVPEIKYIKGPDNDKVDALSRLSLINYDVKERSVTRQQLPDSYGVDQIEGNTFPITYRTIKTINIKTKNW